MLRLLRYTIVTDTDIVVVVFKCPVKIFSVKSLKKENVSELRDLSFGIRQIRHTCLR